MYKSDVYTSLANLAGIPALSVPCGYTEGGLPLGMQIMGKPFDEATVLKVGHLYEQQTASERRLPQKEVKANG